jgi:hypothetical protein
LLFVAQPERSVSVLEVVALTASLPKKLCMWLVYLPGCTIESMFLRMMYPELTMVYPCPVPAAARSPTIAVVNMVGMIVMVRKDYSR